MLPGNGQKLVQSLQRLSFTVCRSLSSAAAPLTDPLEDEHIILAERPKQTGVQVSILENGTKIASCDNGGAISRVIFAVKAGSRFEGDNQLGLSHLLKNAAFSTNGGRTHLRTVREAQQAGGTLECSSSRELISWNSAFMRTKLPEMIENIAPAIVSPSFNSWEMGQVKEHCANDIASLDATAVNLEHLHKAAFRYGLGNSVFCNKLKLGGYTAADLGEYATQQYVGNGIAVVGTNVDHDELYRYSKDLLGGLSGGPTGSGPQQYHGGEIHLTTGTGFSYASLVGAGAGLSGADLPALAVLQRILGYGTSIKWGSNTVSSRLNRAAAKATEAPNMVTSMNISYSDAGLFGVHAVSTPTSIGKVLKAAVDEVKGIANGEVTDEDVGRAKNQVKANVMMLSEGSEELVDDLLKQVLFTGGYASPASVLDKIDAVSLEHVVEAAKQVFGRKSTLVVTGDSSHAPYLDEVL